MRTTVTVDDQLLHEAERIAGESSTSAVIKMALEAYIQADVVRRLLALRGKVQFAVGWEEMERQEMEELTKAGNDTD
jgi:Arc/MetJ family transcription regulator